MKRIYNITVEIDTETTEEAESKIKMLFIGKKIVDIKNVKIARTNLQNRALYLFFRLLSEALNEAGYDMRKTIKTDIDISWTPESIKRYLWLPIMKATTGKTSTAKMNTTDIDKIYDILNKTIGERTGVFVNFPSIDNFRDEDYKGWRLKVFKRDNYTCQKCDKSSCYLEPHHIENWAK